MTQIENDDLIQGIAEILDHPSAFMGGPSRQSLSKAKAIVKEFGAALAHPAPQAEAAPSRDEALRAAAKLILSQPKTPHGPNASAFRIACAYLDGQECGPETTNEIIESFLKNLAGEND